MLSHRTLHPWTASLAALPILLIFGRIATALPDGQEGLQAADPIPLRQVALYEAFEHVAEVWRASQRGDATPEWTDEYLAGVSGAFENLARSGCVEAAAICVRDQRGLRGVSPEQPLPKIELEYRVGLYENLMYGADSAGMGLALELLRSEQELGSGQIETLVRGLAQRHLAPLEVQAQAQLDLAWLLASWSSADAMQGSRHSARLEEAQALYRSIQRQFEGTEYAARASSSSWRLDHLLPGMSAPDFLTQDLAGNEIRLSDFRGQVVVVHLTDSSTLDLGAGLSLSGEKVRRHWDSRFAWVGIHRGGTPAALQAALDTALACGEHAWEGGGSTGAAQAWRVPAGETVVVIGPAGFICAVNPAESLLDRHITDLLGDLQGQGRKRQATSGGGRDGPERPGGGGANRGLVSGVSRRDGGSQAGEALFPGDQAP